MRAPTSGTSGTFEAVREVTSFVAQTDYDSYRANRLLVRAVERSVQIIGEAANRVSDGFRDAHPEIPWRKVAAQRHVLVHDYGEIDQSLIWQLVIEHIPPLAATLQKIIDDRPPVD
ncbi:MAG: DUF86 domain-containing protein [Acidobacteria bacterium]|nr:DUF86 domain-containing protein [Acidobacteriota bacterium]